MSLKALATLSLVKAQEEFKENLSGLQLCSKPNKKCFAVKNFKKGALKLIPLSPNFVSVKNDDTPPSSAVKWDDMLYLNPESGDSFMLYVNPIYGSTDMDVDMQQWIPFFYVATTADKAEANAELSTHVVTFPGRYVAVPVIENKKAIAPGSEILVYKPQKRASASLDASSSKAAKRSNAV